MTILITIFINILIIKLINIFIIIVSHALLNLFCMIYILFAVIFAIAIVSIQLKLAHAYTINYHSTLVF